MTTPTSFSQPPQHQDHLSQELKNDTPARGRFARLPLLAGKSFIPLGLFARLPLAMLTVGALTLVTSVSDSYAIGGTAAGAVGIGSALGAPVLGGLADRHGQRIVLLAASLINCAAVLALILAAYLAPGSGALDQGMPVLVAAFLAGASCPQVGPLARVRWMALTARGSTVNNAKDLDTALSYESTADELTFVLGPALVGVLASLVVPWLPLALAAALTITLVPAFAVHPTHLAVPRRIKPVLKKAAADEPAGDEPAADKPGNDEPRRDQKPGKKSATRFRVAASVALPVAAMVCMGTFFGSTQTALSSFAAGFATSEIAGLLYAVMGLSSAAAALSVAYWSRRISLVMRWLVSAGLMTGFALLLLVPSTALPMILVLLILGLPVGPLMVSVFSIGGLVAPAGKLGTVMTALASGIVAGTALGSSIAGHLAQDHGYSTAFLVPVCAAAVLFLLGTAAAVVLRAVQKRRAGTAA
ncbi:MFS transporter [Arthrobacter sp.]|uniref:MFS transporter n=1 Tax=Arthrobacter sp. TaxID=1667 RepID=UPI002811BB89|nr:MFS transporter [Arthrobacter sp.]